MNGEKMNIRKSPKGQAMPAEVIPIKAEAFDSIDHTKVYWLGSAGILINTRGTTLMIDPLLEGFDMNTLFDSPILPNDVPSLDGILITHIDNDHFSRPTCKDLKGVCKSYHAPQYRIVSCDKAFLNSVFITGMALRYIFIKQDRNNAAA